MTVLLTPRQLIYRIKDLSSYFLQVCENMLQCLRIQSVHPLHRSQKLSTFAEWICYQIIKVNIMQMY